MAREEGFFDDLARGLADGSLTRGKALRLMGAALVGGTLGSLGIREAAGAPPGCKRAGKHCTRTDQCCGSLVCLSGTCQTPTTSTTETPTTSTTETPTTTTTTPCLPSGTCGGNAECCSGRCASGMCAEPCSSDRVLLDNGTCVIERDPNACFCPENCFCRFEADSDQAEPRVFCASDVFLDAPCPNGHSDCPEGQFCEATAGPLGPVCAMAC